MNSGPMDDLETVRLALTEARRRGTSFDAAWTAALATIPAIDEYPRRGPSVDRDQTRAGLAQTRAWWQAAYDRQPAPPPPHRPLTAAHLASMWAEVAVAA